MDGRVCVWRRCGQDPFQDTIIAETEMLSGGSVMVWGCFSHDHKLDLKVVRQTLTGQRYIDFFLSHNVKFPKLIFLRSSDTHHPG